MTRNEEEEERDDSEGEAGTGEQMSAVPRIPRLGRRRRQRQITPRGDEVFWGELRHEEAATSTPTTDYGGPTRRLLTDWPDAAGAGAPALLDDVPAAAGKAPDADMPGQGRGRGLFCALLTAGAQLLSPSKHSLL